MLKFLVRPSRLVSGAFVAGVAFSDRVYKKNGTFTDASLRAPGASSVSSYKAEIQAGKKPCYLEVYITNTNEANGSGHVSMSMLRELRDGAFEVAAHTSYMPIEGGGFVNAPLLGTIPVPAKIFSMEEIREDDVVKANRILRIPISEEALQRGIKKQEEIATAVQDGRYFYSVTGGLNGITRGLAGLMWGYNASNKAFLQHKKEQGFAPYLDPNDMLLLLVQTEEEGPVDVLSCVSAVEEVIGAVTGCEFEKPFFPSDVGVQLKEHVQGAEDVDESLSPYKQKSDLEDDEGERYSGTIEPW